MIKWTFFFEEGNVSSEVVSEEEDERIKAIVHNQVEINNPSNHWLGLPGEQFEMIVNLSRVKCIVREPNAKATPIPDSIANSANQEAKPPEESAAVQENQQDQPEQQVQEPEQVDQESPLEPSVV